MAGCFVHLVEKQPAIGGVMAQLDKTFPTNDCAERFVRILKENLLWVRTFATVEELRQALLDFKRTYNEN
jgi:heterodisulfide reductase subunit A-like polyferredoxin